MFRKLQFYVVLFFLLAPSVLLSQTPLTNAPNFSVLDARGNFHNLYSYLDNGKYILLDFFYNECLVCQTHVPEVNEAYVKFGCNTGEVFFMGINFDNTDGEVISFENEYAILYPNVSGIDGGGNDIVDLFQVIAFPTIILIAPDRSIPKQDIWPLTTVNIIDELLSVGVDTAACPYAFINQPAKTFLFQIYPNPAKDWMSISNLTNEKNLTFNLFDYLGKNVLTQDFSNLKNEKIDISNFKPGIYYIQIFKSGIQLYFEKIIFL